MIPKVGDVTAKRILSIYKDSKSFIEDKGKYLKSIANNNNKLIDNLCLHINDDLRRKAEKEYNFITKNNIKAYFYTDKEYPYRLKNYEDSPNLIYFKGNTDLNPLRSVSIIGTRKPSGYGNTIVKKIVEGLKEYNVTIYSGLAYGIDYLAHREAILNNCPTIGILAHGLNKIYPAAHKSIYKEIQSNGGLLTEFNSQFGMTKINFPRRNRVIAGISDATIIIESPEKGGAMITAEIANSYNKDVFAVPGSILNDKSTGCNKLIHKNKAALITSAEDIAYLMNWERKEESQKKIKFTDFNEEEQKVISIIKTHESLTFDQLKKESGLQVGKLSCMLLDFEFKGIVVTLPGNAYRLC
ncbi:MAG: DNA-processing protein DprA [Hyphomicrobiales bacterium]